MTKIQSICLLDNRTIAVKFCDDDEDGVIIDAESALEWLFEVDEAGDLRGVEVAYESDRARSAWFAVGIDA